MITQAKHLVVGQTIRFDATTCTWVGVVTSIDPSAKMWEIHCDFISNPGNIGFWLSKTDLVEIIQHPDP